MSESTGKTLTTKSQCVREDRVELPPHQSRAFKDAIDGLLLELEEKVGNPTFQLPMLEVFYTRAACSLLSSRQYVGSAFFAWHALDRVPALLFLLDECWGNGLIMLTC